MRARPYLLKLKLKSRRLALRFRGPVQVLPLNEFYRRAWSGEPPGTERFGREAGPRFFFDKDEKHECATALKHYFPQSAAAIVSRANGILSHKFDILGMGTRFLGDNIDWHLDYKSKRRWPKSYHPKIKIVRLTDNSDIKVPWELSRFHFASILGRAFLLTRNSAYKRKFKQLIEDWECENPPDIGPNWTCAMEVAIRVINLIWAVHFFSWDDDDALFLQNLTRLIFYHGLYVERNLEKTGDGANSNHLISNYLGLLFIATLFPEFTRSPRWKDLAVAGLEEEIREQVFPDGVDYESSTSYHRLVLEMFLTAFILGRLNGVVFSQTYKERLYGMVRFSVAITPPSGNAPLIGDNDDGFIVQLSENSPADHRPLVDLGLLLFGQSPPEQIPMSQERLWYLGPSSMVAADTSAPPHSTLFKDSGFAVIRRGEFHMVFYAAGVSRNSLGGHKHNDLLSLTLEIGNFPYLVDPGTYCYSEDYRMRNVSRSTASHNTVTIDDQEQNRYLERRLFYLLPDAQGRIDLWVEAGNHIIVSGWHDGYRRLDDDIFHRRTIAVSLETLTFVVEDRFVGHSKREHTFDIRFVTPSEEVVAVDDKSLKLRGNGGNWLSIASLEERGVEMSVHQTQIFPRYGTSRQAKAIRYRYRRKLPFKVTTSFAFGTVASSSFQLSTAVARQLQNRLSQAMAGIK